MLDQFEDLLGWAWDHILLLAGLLILFSIVVCALNGTCFIEGTSLCKILCGGVK